jgi:hypothetical protein
LQLSDVGQGSEVGRYRLGRANRLPVSPSGQRDIVIAELAVSPLIKIAEGFAVANKKYAHHAAQIVRNGIVLS